MKAGPRNGGRRFLLKEPVTRAEAVIRNRGRDRIRDRGRDRVRICDGVRVRGHDGASGDPYHDFLRVVHEIDSHLRLLIHAGAIDKTRADAALALFDRVRAFAQSGRLIH
ncbi:MAG: hypothetical protein DRJ61_17775 [Acidobacteria bacterium]|nr:MAG: hypothetical protein DRJ61_17775 [Acidobacteriota bacterium]